MIMELRRSRTSALLGMLGALVLGSAPVRDRTPTIQTEVVRRKASKTPGKGRRGLRLMRGNAAEQQRRMVDALAKRLRRGERNLALVTRGGFGTRV